MPDLIPAADLEITSTDLRSIGGQQVGSYTGVTVRHIPSDITVTVNVGRSQHRNRAIALDALAGALTSPSFR